MDEAGLSEPNPSSPDDDHDGDTEKRDRAGLVRTAVWAVLSIAFVGFLAFGTVNARIWRFGELHVESKSIRQVWQVQAQSLPDVSNGWMLQAVFYGSIAVFVGCVILGMRYLLIEANDETSAIAPDRS